MSPGFVYSGVRACVPAGKVHEKSLFWTTESCRNGGSYIVSSERKNSMCHYWLLSFSTVALPSLCCQHLIERSWYAVTETCLAFTVFRDDFSPRFVALFTLLLFLKCFHWLAEDRVDFVSKTELLSAFFCFSFYSKECRVKKGQLVRGTRAEQIFDSQLLNHCHCDTLSCYS